jgi:hypothetical protein
LHGTHETGIVGFVGTTARGGPLVFSCAGNSSYDCTSRFTNSYIFPSDGVIGVAAVPEPATLSLLGLGLAVIGVMRKRKPN